MGNTLTLDLSTLSPAKLQALQAAGLITLPATDSAAAALPPATPAPAAPATPPATDAGTALTTTDQTTSLADKIDAAAAAAGTALAEASPGTLPGKIGAAITLGTSVFDMFFKLFNPHTGQTSYHSNFQDAVDAGAAHMQTQQSDAVANAKDDVAFEVQPVYRVSAADVASMPKTVK